MSEPLDPKKYHVINEEGKRNIIFVSLLFILVLSPLLMYGYYKFAVYRPSQTDKEITLEIKKGQGVFEIADSLYQHDAINSKFLFLIYVYVNRLDDDIQAGVYTIKAGSNVVEITEQLLHGMDDVRITFLEGWRIEEFAREANSKLEDVDYKKFISEAQQYEGYLFPDTYFLTRDIQIPELVSTLRDTFNEKTKDILTSANLERAGLTKEQAVILASIVEREVKSDEDRKIVAGILIKRWKENLKLDADATTQYATAYQKSCLAKDYCAAEAPIKDEKNITWWPSSLSNEDLQNDSPYNTRKNTGLPPSPISSVSISSLSAVLNSRSSDYYYYLNDMEGNTHYARTLEEHNVNIQKYLLSQ
ncbi:MAG TPA: endolytic transglycosylase MltG [bacterium]|nr:endolytic transglycosylase MltG [bacterium]